MGIFKGRLTHNPEYYLEGPSSAKPLLRPPQHPKDRSLEKIWKQTGGKRVVMHLGSGSSIKNWPLERFVRLSEKLRDLGCQVLWMAGPAEADLQIAESFPLVRDREIVDLVYLFGQSDLFVGNDGGISHCAAATDLPCVLLFGPSDPIVWRPFGGRITILSRHLDCGPCHAPFQMANAERSRAKCRRECMTALSVEEVFKACLESL
jgi:ADP-heptose:LPS heptosyltransferase